MKRKIKNQILPVLKKAVGNYHNLKYESVKRHREDPDDDDYRINIYQLDKEGKRTDTIHPIEDICAVTKVFNVHCYVTRVYNEDVICVALF